MAGFPSTSWAFEGVAWLSRLKVVSWKVFLKRRER